MNSNDKKNFSATDRDLKDFFRLLSTFVPTKSIDGAKYLIDYWDKWAQSSEFREKALMKWNKIDRILSKAFDTPQLKADMVNTCICQSVPEAFRDFPIWQAKTIRIAGRDVSPSELFTDPFTCILAWCGVLGVRKESIVPGYLLSASGQYLYDGLLGSLANLGHFFSNPAWRFAVVSEIAKQYNLKTIAGNELLGNVSTSQDEIFTLVHMLKKVIAWADHRFDEQFSCMSGADSFYTQCLYAYNPGIQSMQVRSTTSGAVIPLEKSGGKTQGKHSARQDYFEKGLLGPGSEKIRIFYQWDRNKTAMALAKEQKKAEGHDLGIEHRQDAINILSEYLKKPNIELSEGSFSGIWEWKNFFTLVSDQKVAFSGRDEELKRINHGLWVNHNHRSFLTTCIKELMNSDELTADQKTTLQQGLPDAKRVNELTMLLYNAENKRVLKPQGEIMAEPLGYATDVVDDLLNRGAKLLKEAGKERT